MFKIFRFISLLIFVMFPFSTNAHVQHYKDLKSIKFDIYRNGTHIGAHIFSFKKSGDELAIKSEIKFEIKKFGIVFYKYYAEGIEIYKDNKLIKFNSTTDQNGKLKYANIEINNNNYIIDGSAYKGEVPLEFLIGTWWNHDIVEAPAQISAVSGRIIKQKVKFLAKEIVKFGEKQVTCLWHGRHKNNGIQVEKQTTWQYNVIGFLHTRTHDFRPD